MCPHSCIPYADTSRSQELMGPPTFFDASLPACHGLWTPADLHILAKTDTLVLPSVHVKTLGIRNSHIEAVPARQGTRVPLRPPGFSVDASSIWFAVITTTTPRGLKTRYGWGASPYPTGTFTRQETPSFSWRANGSANPPGWSEAESRSELSALFDNYCIKLIWKN